MRCIKCANNNIYLLGDSSGSIEDVVFTSEYEYIPDLNGNKIKVDRVQSQMWGGGTVTVVSVGYGSIYDGDVYVIGICDNCLKSGQENGSVIYKTNYMYRDEEREQLSRIKFRRDNNLDNIIS